MTNGAAVSRQPKPDTSHNREQSSRQTHSAQQVDDGNRTDPYRHQSLVVRDAPPPERASQHAAEQHQQPQQIGQQQPPRQQRRKQWPAAAATPTHRRSR